MGISRETSYAVILFVRALPGNFPETFSGFPEKKNLFHRNLCTFFTGIRELVPISHFVSIGPGGHSGDPILGTQTFWTASASILRSIERVSPQLSTLRPCRCLRKYVQLDHLHH